MPLIILYVFSCNRTAIGLHVWFSTIASELQFAVDCIAVIMQSVYLDTSLSLKALFWYAVKNIVYLAKICVVATVARYFKSLPQIAFIPVTLADIETCPPIQKCFSIFANQPAISQRMEIFCNKTTISHH